MRPISLYEILRKAWTTIIAKRIHQLWHDMDLLHKSQHGYRLDNGTPMALHTIINEIEDAKHSKKTKALTFWDIKRAFDSIPRNIQRLAWVRLGVPHDIAEWFVGLDDGGLSFISSPFYHQKKNLRSPDELKAKPGHFITATDLSFSAERGIGQGESASSLMWTALYDILLEWIDPANRQMHQYNMSRIWTTRTKTLQILRPQHTRTIWPRVPQAPTACVCSSSPPIGFPPSVLLLAWLFIQLR
jgi:hypothetical protein